MPVYKVIAIPAKFKKGKKSKKDSPKKPPTLFHELEEVNMSSIHTITVLPADPEGMNDSRAEWAQKALDVFASVTSMDTAGETGETILADLIADFMHWSDRNGVKFSEVLALAQSVYVEEITLPD